MSSISPTLMLSRSFFPNFGQGPFPKIAGKKSCSMILASLLVNLSFGFATRPRDYKKNYAQSNKGAKIRSQHNQVPHPTQDTNGEVTNSQLDTTNESQEVSPFPEGDHKAQINRRAQRHSKHKTEQKHKRSTKEVPPWNGQ